MVTSKNYPKAMSIEVFRGDLIFLRYNKLKDKYETTNST